MTSKPELGSSPKIVRKTDRSPSSSSSRSFKRKALVVDDVPVTQSVTKAALHLARYACDVAKDGSSAIDLAKKSRYDLILMDIQLPGVDGTEATRRIRAAESERKEKEPAAIFGLTSACTAEELERYRSAGMDGCIEKGCVLAEALDQVTRGESSPGAAFLFVNSRNLLTRISDKETEKETS